MKSILVIALTFFAFGAWAANDVHGHKDENEVRLIKDNKRTLNVSYQYQLRNQPNWQNFLLDNGTWYVHFNEANGKPHKAFGKPIIVPGSNAVERAAYFVEHHLQDFGIPIDELELLGTGENKHAEHVFFGQMHQGKKVLNAKLSVRLNTQGKVVSFSTDVFKNISVDNASLDASEAASAAMAGITETVVNVEANSELMILPIPDYVRKRTVFKSVYEITVYTMDEDNIPANYLTYVDAADGTILERTNLVCHSENTPLVSDITVTDDLSLTQPYDPETNTILPHLEVTQGGNTFYTDVNGSLTGLDEVSTTFSMEGLWARVVSNGVTPSFTTTLTNGVNAIDWGINANSRESSAFYHVNVVHDYMKTKFPSFTNMDNALTTVVTHSMMVLLLTSI
jgi:Zn-dependent metalloprotease